MTLTSQKFSPNDIIGTWDAMYFDEQEPCAHSIISACLEIFEDGTCRFQAQMDETQANTIFGCGGTWSIHGYFLGFKRHFTEFGIKDNPNETIKDDEKDSIPMTVVVELDAERTMMALLPDPFIAIRAQSIQKTVYKRSA